MNNTPIEIFLEKYNCISPSHLKKGKIIIREIELDGFTMIQKIELVKVEEGPLGFKVSGILRSTKIK